MNVTFTKSNKQRKGTSVVFDAPGGYRGSVKFAKSLFGDAVPETLSIDAEFATPKAKLTAEQRKELRKNAPKLTAQQKLQKLQERAARLQAKLDIDAAKAAADAANSL